MKYRCALLTVLCTFLLLATAFAVDAGDLGNVSWKWEDGTMTISGSGEMPNRTSAKDSDSGSAYYQVVKHCEDTVCLIIENGITKIGSEAFCNFTALQTVILGESVTRIRASAFSGCTALEAVYIPKSVTAIANQAFWNCDNLTVYYAGNETEWKGIGKEFDSFCEEIIIQYNATPQDPIKDEVLSKIQKLSETQICIDAFAQRYLVAAYNADGRQVACSFTSENSGITLRGNITEIVLFRLGGECGFLPRMPKLRITLDEIKTGS